MVRYIIGVVAQQDKFQDKVLPTTGLRLGIPILERAGVAQRRFIFQYDFTAQEIIDIEDIGRVNGMVLADLIKDTFPIDWRYPIWSPS